jgi:hypothetical protein
MQYEYTGMDLMAFSACPPKKKVLFSFGLVDYFIKDYFGTGV